MGALGRLEGCDDMASRKGQAGIGIGVYSADVDLRSVCASGTVDAAVPSRRGYGEFAALGRKRDFGQAVCTEGTLVHEVTRLERVNPKTVGGNKRDVSAIGVEPGHEHKITAVRSSEDGTEGLKRLRG